MARLMGKVLEISRDGKPSGMATTRAWPSQMPYARSCSVTARTLVAVRSVVSRISRQTRWM